MPPTPPDQRRCILFAEVPSFYAAVERAEDPALAGRPVIVGGDPRKNGRVQAATADALAAGVRVDMPMLEALRLCPRARRVRTDMARYREISRRLFAALRRGVPRLEPFGLGAAYFEIAAQDPEQVAAELRRLAEEEVGLPLRVGIAQSKYLARLAAEEAGEGGLLRVAPGDEQAFLSPLPVTRLEGVGQKTAAKLAELGARTIGDVAGLGRERLQEAFGTHGLRIEAYALGADAQPVRAARHPQSLSREATLRGEGVDLAVLEDQLQDLAARLESELRIQGLAAGKVSLKLRFEDQERTSRSRTLSAQIARAGEIRAVAVELLGRTQAGSRPVRGLGLQLGGLVPAGVEERQLDLFD